MTETMTDGGDRSSRGQQCPTAHPAKLLTHFRYRRTFRLNRPIRDGTDRCSSGHAPADLGSPGTRHDGRRRPPP